MWYNISKNLHYSLNILQLEHLILTNISYESLKENSYAPDIVKDLSNRNTFSIGFRTEETCVEGSFCALLHTPSH